MSDPATHSNTELHRSCRNAHACFAVAGLAALIQAAVLAIGLYEAYEYRDWKRPLGFIFESLQWDHGFNLLWFWLVVVLSFAGSWFIASPGNKIRTHYVGAGIAGILALVNIPQFWLAIMFALIPAWVIARPGNKRVVCYGRIGMASLLTLLMVPLIDQFRNFAREDEVWQLLGIYLAYGFLVLYLGISGFIKWTRAS